MHTEAADDDGDGDEDGEGEAYINQEEDEGRDSGGYYEDEEADGEPYESQPASDSGHSLPDFTADVDIDKSDMMTEEEKKPAPALETAAENKPGEFFLVVNLKIQYEICSVDEPVGSFCGLLDSIHIHY